MSVLGIGVDLVENARIEHSLDRFGVSTVNKLDGFKPSSFARAEFRACGGSFHKHEAEGGRFSDADVMRTENLQIK